LSGYLFIFLLTTVLLQVGSRLLDETLSFLLYQLPAKVTKRSSSRFYGVMLLRTGLSVAGGDEGSGRRSSLVSS
jgi:hypothetical protein